MPFKEPTKCILFVFTTSEKSFSKIFICEHCFWWAPRRAITLFLLAYAIVTWICHFPPVKLTIMHHYTTVIRLSFTIDQNTQITTLSSWPPITKIPSRNHAQNQINKAMNPTKFQHLPLTSKPRANSNTNVIRHIDFESDECLL